MAHSDTRANTRHSKHRSNTNLPHSLPPTPQLASDIQLAGGIELAHCHTALPTATQLASGIQLANCHSLPAATELANGT